MNKLKGFRLAAVIFTALFLGPGIVQAQRPASAQASGRMLPARPANSVRARPSQAPRITVARSRGPITTGLPSPNDRGNGFVGFGGAPLSVQQLLDPVPGLGFDYADLAARDQDLDIKAAIDPATQWRLAIAERLLRDNRGFGGFVGTGGYILDGGGVYTVPEEPASEPAAAAPAPQPQIIVVQAPAAANQQGGATAPSAESQGPPLPDVGQFTLVLRDGTKIQAVAFTRKSDTIVYITTDGSRRTLAVADLDSAATQRVNQERGTPLNLSL
jgi:nucleoid-associated protein YgaU